ncbi:hypothetical protein [Actinomadura chokoriensis]|uniref:hypothetical protein n=1 Tax=Actinomadura chokoriensis TaxID=454156 RepID=UPI0031F7BECB
MTLYVYVFLVIVAGCFGAVALAVWMALVRRRHTTEDALGALYSQYLAQVERQATARVAEAGDGKEWLADLQERACVAAQEHPRRGRRAQHRAVRRIERQAQSQVRRLERDLRRSSLGASEGARRARPAPRTSAGRPHALRSVVLWIADASMAMLPGAPQPRADRAASSRSDVSTRTTAYLVVAVGIACIVGLLVAVSAQRGPSILIW